MKNKYLILFLFLFLLKTTTGYSTTHTITSVAFSVDSFGFSPVTVSAVVGDTILFNLNAIHFPIEVDSTHWANNDSTSNGGFDFPPGNGQFAINGISEEKIYYYVCGRHFAMGMKGRIIVTGPNGINSLTNAPPGLEVFPNPFSTGTTIKTNLPVGKENQMRIFDMSGKCIYQKNNISPVQYLDLSGFSSGTYFVAVKSDDIFLEKKLIVSR